MATSDLDSFTQGEDRFGENVARTQRVVAKLLFDWVGGSDLPGDGSSAAVRSRSHLRAIYFDKLTELFCRWWDELNRRGDVRYPTSFTKRRGFHGPGRSLRIDRAGDAAIGIDLDDHRHTAWAFTTEVVEKLNPSLGAARNLFVLAGESWKHSCKITPGIDASQWDAWLAEDCDDADSVFLSPPEVKLVESISKVIRLLSAEEVRVLGTHCTAAETTEDIKFNLDVWGRRFGEVRTILRGEANAGSGRPLDANRAAYQLVTTSREVRLKAFANRSAYGGALALALRHCDSTALRAVIETVQMPAASLWENQTILRFSKASQILIDFSLYLRRGLNEAGIIRPLKGKEVEESDEAFGRLGAPLPNLRFELRPYSEIKACALQFWASDLDRCRGTIFDLLPPVLELSDYGIPN